MLLIARRTLSIKTQDGHANTKSDTLQVCILLHWHLGFCFCLSPMLAFRTTCAVDSTQGDLAFPKSVKIERAITRRSKVAVKLVVLLSLKQPKMDSQ